MKKERIGRVIKKIVFGGFISILVFTVVLTLITFFSFSSYIPERFWKELFTFPQGLFFGVLGGMFAFLKKMTKRKELKVICSGAATISFSIFAVENYLNPPVFLTGIGGMLNFMVMAFNKGKMPVMENEGKILFLNKNTYCIASDKTRFKILADHSLTLGGSSIGDIILAVGLYWVTVYLTIILIVDLLC